ncbi:hypothetical protein [Geodermatophilus sp. CPCC 205506]|uniref:hypothetical protein n=1 Tax=Geodermatophilus sp. CPCC 205506 TaxID=2936596 RepID=UPI003EF068E5
MYNKVAGICLATALFICGVAGFPTPPSALPASTGTLVMTEGGHASAVHFAPGAEIALRGGGFAAGAAVTVAVYSRPQALLTTKADGSGVIDVSVELPADLAPGRHTLVALGLGPDGTAISLQSPITVVAANPAAQLAYTGFNVLTYLVAGLALIVVGLVLLRTGLMRRRLVPASTGGERVRVQ